MISKAIAESMQTEAGLQAAATEMIDFHEVRRSFKGVRPLPFPEYAANLLMRGLWHEWRLKKDELGWPADFLSADACRGAIINVLQDSESFDRFTENIAFRPVQTTVPSRAIGPRIVIEANRDRFRRPINLVSIGHSLGIGEKKLLLNDAFSPIRVRNWYSYDANILEESPQDSRLLMQKLSQPVDYGDCFAMDIFPGDKDEATKQWALSSFTPAEQMDSVFMGEVGRLIAEQPANYRSLRGDFSDIEPANEISRKLGDRKADIVLFSTIWHQLTEADRSHMLDNAMAMLSPQGLIIVQDFVESRPSTYETDNALNQLHFFNDWRPWTYRAQVLDPSQTGRQFQEAIYFIDGRCGAARFSDDYKVRLFGSV